MVLDDLAKRRDIHFSGPAFLLQYLPKTEVKPPCLAIAPVSGRYLCGEPKGHTRKHRAQVGDAFEVLWKVI
jgi:hypothetical protein